MWHLLDQKGHSNLALVSISIFAEFASSLVATITPNFVLDVVFRLQASYTERAGSKSLMRERCLLHQLLASASMVASCSDVD